MKRFVCIALLLACCDGGLVTTRVCLVGDSNAVGVMADLSHALGVIQLGDHSLRSRSDVLIPISAVSGAQLHLSKGLYPGRFATARVDCDQLVVVLGTNDLGNPEAPLGDALDQEIDSLLGIPEIAGRSVLWVAPSPTSPLHPQDRVAEWREALWRAEQRWPLLEVQDVPTEWLGEDGVHYTQQGYAQLARALARRLEDMP